MPPNQRAASKNVLTLSSPVRFRTSAKITNKPKNGNSNPKNTVKGVLFATNEPSLCCSPNTVKPNNIITTIAAPEQICNAVHPLLLNAFTPNTLI